MRRIINDATVDAALDAVLEARIGALRLTQLEHDAIADVEADMADVRDRDHAIRRARGTLQ